MAEAPFTDINLIALIEQFRSEDKCRAYLAALRWPDGVSCPRCSSCSVSYVSARSVYDCNTCRHQFSVTAGTIFHDTHLPLWKWFLTTYMMIESRKGISANQVKRSIGVSYKTAWYLCHRIRTAMQLAAPLPLAGTVEVDETFVGGKVKGKGRGYRGNKTTVLGVIQRGGNVHLKVAPGTDRETLHGFIAEHTAPDTEAIYTDEWPAYQGVADGDTMHETVNHRLKEWVRGEVHTNSIENVWSLLDRSIMGAYHHVSAKHLDRYLDELGFRFNNRENPYLFRDTMRVLVQSENMPYAQLTATSAVAHQ